MIPAILSVVFVVYLYQSLKETSEVAEERVAGDSTDLSPDDLIAKLQSLQSRCEQLVDGNKIKGADR